MRRMTLLLRRALPPPSPPARCRLRPRCDAARAASASAAPPERSWASVGLCPTVAAALRALALPSPTPIQHLATPPFLEGRHLVLAAETGSGKTLAYLAPLASLAAASPPPAGSQPLPPRFAVLVPNAMLAAQVAQVANGLVCAQSGQRLLPCVALGGPQQATLRSAAAQRAALVVATPAKLLDELFCAGVASGGWGEAEEGAAAADDSARVFSSYAAALRCLVTDEADMLLSGGFERPLKKLIQLLDAEEAERRKAAPQAAARQYVFAAATLHSSGRCTPGETLREGFPEALWLATPRLHSPSQKLTHVWREVGAEDEAAAVAAALLDGWAAEAAEGGAAERSRALVFCNTAAGASALAAELAAAHSIPCAAYGAEQGSAARREALLSFRGEASEEGAEGGSSAPLRVLVCTDAASRGLDVPSVRHVVQAGFALSAVDFLHRAGRTVRTRDSPPGRLTSLVAPSSARLARALRAAVESSGALSLEGAEEGEGLAGAFSRKRSFSKKFKKYGEGRTGTPDAAKAEGMAERAAAREARYAAREPRRPRGGRGEARSSEN